MPGAKLDLHVTDVEEARSAEVVLEPAGESGVGVAKEHRVGGRGDVLQRATGLVDDTNGVVVTGVDTANLHQAVVDVQRAVAVDAATSAQPHPATACPGDVHHLHRAAVDSQRTIGPIPNYQVVRR